MEFATRNHENNSLLTDAELFNAISELDFRGRFRLKQYRKSQGAQSAPSTLERDIAVAAAVPASTLEAQYGVQDAHTGALATPSRKPSLGKKKAFRTSSITAKEVGSSPRQVEKVRTILDHATPEVQEAILAGQISIEEGYRVSISERNAKRIAARSASALRPSATLIGILLEISRSFVQMDSCVRPLEPCEKQLLLRIGQKLEAIKLLTPDEYRSLEIALCPPSNTKFGGPLNSTEGKRP